MRLIDADTYAAEMRRKQENCRIWKDSLDRGSETYARAEQSFITFVEAALTLKSQPTIDAIPVEWLRNIHKNSILTRNDMEFRDWLIEKWQKEQEANQ